MIKIKKILSLDLGITSIGYSILNEFENDKYSLFIYVLKVLKEEYIHKKESQQFFYKFMKMPYGYCFNIYYLIDYSTITR